jgi:hypothetical protein
MSNPPFAIKQLSNRLPKQVDEALDEHVRGAEKWASKVRLMFALTFVAAAIWSWNHQSHAKFVYLMFAAAWVIVMIAVNLRISNGASDSIVTTTTFIDLTIIHLGILAFIQQGLFPKFGAGLYLCYLPILAIASNRYRIGLVIQAGLYSAIVYAALSLSAGSPPWLRILVLLATTLILAMGSRKPKNLMVNVAGKALQEAFDLGAKQKEEDLTAQFHQLFFPPSIVDLPMIWSSSKHGAGTETNGDYYHVFNTGRGPLVAVGDLPGHGFEAFNEVTKLHEELEKIVSREANLTKILGELNTYVWEKYRGSKTFTCVLAQWEGEQMFYANAGHLPAIQMSKQEQKQLPVTCGPVGAQPEAIFKDAVAPFPARDLVIIYTDGLYKKLTDDRDQGIAEIERFADKFTGAEVNTLCHRIFDCAQPGMEPNTDDSTIVVIRRQPAAVSAMA